MRKVSASVEFLAKSEMPECFAEASGLCGFVMCCWRSSKHGYSMGRDSRGPDVQLSTGSTRSGRGSRFPLGVHGPAVSQAEDLIVI